MSSNHIKVFEEPEPLNLIDILPLKTCNGCPFHPGKPPIDDWWGKGIKNGVDYIFLRSRASGLQSTMGGAGEMEFLKVLKQSELDSFLLGGCTLCRPRNGMIWPSDKNDRIIFQKALEHCKPNIETKLQHILDANRLVGRKPPIITLLGRGAIYAFFPKLEEKTIPKFKEYEPYGLDQFPGAQFQASYDPTSTEVFFNQLKSYIYQLTITEEKKITLLKNYHRIDTIEDFNNLMDDLKKKEIISFDIETSGLRYKTMKKIIEKKSKGHITRTETWDKDVIIGISFAHETRSGYYIPLYVKLKHFTTEQEEYIQNVSGDDNPFELTENTTLNDYRFWFGKKLNDYVYTRLKALLENPNIKKVAHNGKFDCKFLKEWWNIDVKGFYWDTMLASHALDENTFNSLEFHSGSYPDLLNYKKKVKSKVSKISFEDESYADVDLNTLATYGGQDADLTLRLYYDQLKLIEEEKAKKTNLPNDWVNSEWMIKNFYMPSSHVYQKAETIGIYFDKEFAEKTYLEYKESMKEMQSKIDAVLKLSSTPEHPIGPYDTKNTSRWINLNSPLQKQKLFYGDLGWPKFKETKAAKKKRTKGSSSHIKNEDASTDQDSLKQTLEYFYETDKVGKEAEIELIEWILEYSKKHKMINTYLKGKKLLNRLDENGFINYIMKLHGTVSGRYSSSPNVQNLPRRTPSITTLTGRIIEPSNIRGIFTAPPPFKLFSSDLSQAELRIMADYANDIMMLDYIKRKEDIHWTGCLKIFYKDQKLIYDSKNPEMKRLRKLTKLCNFGGLYGGSDRKKVSSVNEKLELGEPKIDLKIAGAHTEWFNSEFPDIQNYIKVQNDHIAKYGWVDNKFGRRRRLPDVFTKDKYLIAEAQRQGINCVDELTQCLTKRGWLSYNQVTLDDEILTKNIDTGFLEWDKIQAINVYDNYQGDMYLFENKENNISALTTPDHRWLVKYSTRFSEDNLLERDQRKNELINNRDMLKEKIIKLKENNLNPLQISKRLNISYIKVRRMLNLTKKSSKDYRDLKPIHEYLTSEELSKLNQVKSIHLSGKYQGSVIKYYDNDLIELIGWILTDGHLSYYNSGQPSRVSLTQSFIANPEKCQIIKDLILRLNLKVSEKKRDRSYIWRFQSSLGRTLHEIIPHKKITMEFLLKLTNEQLNILLKSIQLGDGKRITTVNRNHLDMFQALIILTGQSSNSSLRDNIGRKSYSDKLSHNQKYIEKKQISYHINIHKRKYVHHKNTRKQDTFFKLIKNYQGIIWCPTVKNSNMICRRFANNKYYQFITGQSQIQGTASDIVQLSIIRITKWLEENQMQSKIIYSVHDELDGYGHPEELEILKEVIPKMMCEKVFPIDKIKVELESEFDVYNHRWGD